jgi:hypothetical protein
MVILLNVVWFLIAAGSLVAYIWLTPPIDRRHWRLGFVALVCICVLLLPVISITDDLNSEAFTIEDFNIGKKLLKSAVHLPVISIVDWVTISLIAAFLAILRRGSWRKIEAIAESCSDPSCIPLILARAPPNVL